ncbi:MAG: DUF342 domain-containing protein [Firmicutes bacterium]|nr:DUF342 domain-containing protein [Bacillota bacterium]
MERACVLSISEDNLEAYLCVLPNFTGDIKDLQNILVQAGIKFGLLHEALGKALLQRNQPLCVAKGTPPQPGTDDSITLHFPEEELTGEMITKLSEDLRLSYEVPSVKPGEVIAVWQRGRDGENGQDIMGRTIAPPRCRRLKITCRQGTELREDGKIIATMAGRPCLAQTDLRYRFEVMPVYIHAQDLTAEMPHLKYDGDVVIKGNVLEGTSVKATGTVDVLGNVIGSAIETKKSVRINGNLIQSSVQAGYDLQALQELHSVLQKISDSLTLLTAALEQLQEQPQFQKLPFAIVVEKILKLRHPTFQKDIGQLTTILTEITKNVPELTATFSREQILNKLDFQQWETSADLDTALTQTMALQQQIDSFYEIEANINCKYALNSHLTAAQHISINGQGCFHSQLLAGSTVTISNIARGGIIKAGQTIKVNRVGSEAGAATTLQVGRLGVIEVLTAHENTLFIVGSNKLKLGEILHNTRVRLDQDARIALHPRY